MLASVRRGSLPPAAITIALLIATVPAAVAGDEPRAVVAAVVAGIVAIAGLVHAPWSGRVRGQPGPGDVPGYMDTSRYLVAVAATTGLASTHAAAGAVAGRRSSAC